MVDAAASLRPGQTEQMLAKREDVATAPVWAVSQADQAALAEYRGLAATATVSPSQSAGWIDAWVSNVAPDSTIAVARVRGKPVMAVALEIERRGPFRVAQFMGGTHACGNFPPLAKDFAQRDAAEITGGLQEALRDSRPDIDMLSLQRIARDLNGVPNPLLALPHLNSPNIALATSLQGGFDALLKRASGKRKKKKHRWQTRKFEAAGSFRRFQATTPEEVARVLEQYFAMKEKRFREKGIIDVFGGTETRAFFRALFTDALDEPRPSFVLHALEVGGTIRAVTGSTVSDRRLTCEFGGIYEDELASVSPGDFLFFDNIKEACEQGYEVYDFSVGDELYKRLWCDIEIQQADAYVALSTRGKILVAAMRAQNRAKSFVKNSPLLWKLVKAVRKQKAPLRDDEDE